MPVCLFVNFYPHQQFNQAERCTREARRCEHPKTVFWPDDPIQALPTIGWLWPSKSKTCQIDIQTYLWPHTYSIVQCSMTTTIMYINFTYIVIKDTWWFVFQGSLRFTSILCSMHPSSAFVMEHSQLSLKGNQQWGSMKIIQIKLDDYLVWQRNELSTVIELFWQRIFSFIIQNLWLWSWTPFLPCLESCFAKSYRLWKFHMWKVVIITITTNSKEEH